MPVFVSMSLRLPPSLRAERSNPLFGKNWIAWSLTLLAMTNYVCRRSTTSNIICPRTSPDVFRERR
jgi:hypothetical protein